MKIGVLILTAFLSMPVLSQPTRPYEFEVEPGCVMKKDEGRCVIVNKFNGPIECTVSISGKTLRGIHMASTRITVIPPKSYDDSARLYVTKDDVLISVSASADCRAE